MKDGFALKYLGNGIDGAWGTLPSYISPSMISKAFNGGWNVRFWVAYLHLLYLTCSFGWVTWFLPLTLSLSFSILYINIKHTPIVSILLWYRSILFHHLPLLKAVFFSSRTLTNCQMVYVSWTMNVSDMFWGTASHYQFDIFHQLGPVGKCPVTASISWVENGMGETREIWISPEGTCMVLLPLVGWHLYEGFRVDMTSVWIMSHRTSNWAIAKAMQLTYLFLGVSRFTCSTLIQGMDSPNSIWEPVGQDLRYRLRYNSCPNIPVSEGEHGKHVYQCTTWKCGFLLGLNHLPHFSD